MTPYPSAFEELWEHYPARPNNPKLLAFKCYRQRLLQGVAAAELLASVKEYASQMKRAGKVGTEFIMQARTFLGPNERWKEFVPKPPAPGSRPGPMAWQQPKPHVSEHSPEGLGRTAGSVKSDREERIDARPFLRELIEKLASKKAHA